MSIRRSTDRSRPARRDKTVTRSYAVLRRAAPPLLRARGPDGAPPLSRERYLFVARTVLVPRENGTPGYAPSRPLTLTLWSFPPTPTRPGCGRTLRRRCPPPARGAPGSPAAPPSSRRATSSATSRSGSRSPARLPSPGQVLAPGRGAVGWARSWERDRRPPRIRLVPGDRSWALAMGWGWGRVPRGGAAYRRARRRPRRKSVGEGNLAVPHLWSCVVAALAVLGGGDSLFRTCGRASDGDRSPRVPGAAGGGPQCPVCPSARCVLVPGVSCRQVLAPYQVQRGPGPAAPVLVLAPRPGRVDGACWAPAPPPGPPPPGPGGPGGGRGAGGGGP